MYFTLLSRRSQQRERLNAMGLSICLFKCLFVCLSVCLSVYRENAKTRFSQKLSNFELWSLLTTYRKSYIGFLKTHYWTPEIQRGGDLPSWKSTWRHFLDKISQIGAEWHADCDSMVETETGSRIPIWRTFVFWKPEIVVSQPRTEL